GVVALDLELVAQGRHGREGRSECERVRRADVSRDLLTLADQRAGGELQELADVEAVDQRQRRQRLGRRRRQDGVGRREGGGRRNGRVVDRTLGDDVVEAQAVGRRRRRVRDRQAVGVHRGVRRVEAVGRKEQRI